MVAQPIIPKPNTLSILISPQATLIIDYDTENPTGVECEGM